MEDSGAIPQEDTLAVGSDRAGTMRVDLNGRAGVLRAGPKDGDVNPVAAKDILDTLETVGVERVPRVLASGEVSDVVYAVESVVRGSRPRRLTDELISEIGGYLATLPTGQDPPTSAREDIEGIAIALPRMTDDLLEIGDRLAPHIKNLPSVVSHRDLWAGNVFVEEGRLSGIIDWDGGHIQGVPGVDLIQLFISQYREQQRGDIGHAWLEKIWRTDRFADATRSYWNAMGLAPTQVALDAIAIAWWAGWLHQAIERHERRLADEPWLAANVSSVLSEAKGPPLRLRSRSTIATNCLFAVNAGVGIRITAAGDWVSPVAQV